MGVEPEGAGAREAVTAALASRRARRAILRAAAGFAIGVALWAGFSRPYERLLARASEIVLRAGERPAVTRLEARDGEILVDRSDFPPASPRPGLPAADVHFNFVILTALFAASRPWRAGPTAIGLGVLFAVHVLAVVGEVESLYATRLGEWSAAHYGVVARNVWTAAFHFYQIAGRFAAPFAIWWPLDGMSLTAPAAMKDRRSRKSKSG